MLYYLSSAIEILPLLGFLSPLNFGENSRLQAILPIRGSQRYWRSCGYRLSISHLTHLPHYSPLLSKPPCPQVFLAEGQFPWLEEIFSHQNSRESKIISKKTANHFKMTQVLQSLYVITNLVSSQKPK